MLRTSTIALSSCSPSFFDYAQLFERNISVNAHNKLFGRNFFAYVDLDAIVE